MGLPSLTGISTQFDSITALDMQIIVNNVVASIGMGEVALAHLMNAEGEKLQALLGTTNDGDDSKIETKQDLIDMNLSVGEAIANAGLYESSLTKKLSSVVFSRNNLRITLNDQYFYHNVNIYNLYPTLEDAVFSTNGETIATSIGILRLKDLQPYSTYYLEHYQSLAADQGYTGCGTDVIIPDYKYFKLETGNNGRVINITAILAFTDPEPILTAQDVKQLNYTCETP